MLFGVLLFLSVLNLSKARVLSGTDASYVSEMEASMARILRDYADREANKVDLLKERAAELEFRSQSHNTTEANPVSMFISVKQLVTEWNELEQLMNKSTWTDLATVNLTTPRSHHVGEVVKALFRVQDVYDFDAIQIALGMVPQLKDAGLLSGKHCFDLGRIAREFNDHYHALVWFQAAIYRLSGEVNRTMDPVDIYPLMALTMDNTNNTQRAKQMARLFFEIADREKFQRALKTYPDLEKLLGEDEDAEEGEWLDFGDLPQMVNYRTDWYDAEEQPKFEEMCRQEAKAGGGCSTDSQVPPPPDSISHSCHYDRSSSFLSMAPAKIEVLQTNPEVHLYRDVISEVEAEVIKSLVKQRMLRSIIGGINGSGALMPAARESFTGWISDKDHPIVAGVRSRIAAFTKMSLNYSEDLQVSMYGIGGHYRPHFDAFKRDPDPRCRNASSFTFSRLATFMLYLAEPISGGATVFPIANVTVTPSKGDAVFWYNLDPNGKGDDRSLHAGCPIIMGTKWVANQWIKLEGQEFLKPCKLTDD